MPGGRPRLTASEHFRLGTYRRDRHGPLPWEKPSPEAAPKPAAGDDSVWKHELRLPRAGETIGDAWREAMEYRAQTN
jgi:hypothetical protein